MMSSSKPLFSLLFICILWVSCNPIEHFSYYTLYLNIDDLHGLVEDGDIISNNKKIGKVGDITTINNDNHIVILRINRDVLIPRNSDIRVITDMESSKAYIEIVFSHSKKNYNENDTLQTEGTILFNKNIHLQEVNDIPKDLPEGIKNLLK
ncbi:MAG: hypothetical protein M9887_02520 [Chitinophagales bacterium]|nr:hypothetical protein [Chitinophagales bacterium]